MTITQHPRRIMKIGFLIAGCVNFFGTLVVSLGFTNRLLMSLDPAVFSPFGLICIMLWGMAYVAVSKTYQNVPYVVLVFVVEKLVYTVAWIIWITRFGDQLSGLLSDAPMTGVFYMTYGLVDFSFGVFFAWVALTTLRGRSSIKANP